MLNASREFAKGDPKNYIPDDSILRIAETFKAWQEEEKFSRIVTREEVAKNDFNISPSRYIHTGEGEEYRPIARDCGGVGCVGRGGSSEPAQLCAAVLEKLGVQPMSWESTPFPESVRNGED